ncbi:MAG: right-handed parallel beta-helix repeat-containing protein, partial [Planctomycetes bacterium]|nr:right-handed parallel beta-helix repeat-containing protein [Planctomycetota bacterium]
MRPLHRLALLTCIAWAAGAPLWSAEGRTWVVSQAAAGAGDDQPGTEAAPLRTIQAAAERAQAGDTVLVRAGIYRERVAPPRGGEEGRPIIYRGAAGEVVRVVGCDPWAAAWRPVEGRPGIWSAPLPSFPDANPYRTGFRCGWDPKKQEEPVARPAAGPRLRQTLGQLIVEGHPLIQVEFDDLLAQPGTWMVDAAGEAVRAHLPGDADPGLAKVELTVRDRLFAPAKRGLGHIRVEGFHFAFCANQGPWPTRGAVSVRAGHHWEIVGNTVRHCTSIGIDAGSEHWDARMLTDPGFRQDPGLRASDITVRGNQVHDNGLTGIFAMELRGTSLIAGNRIERNN